MDENQSKHQQNGQLQIGKHPERKSTQPNPATTHTKAMTIARQVMREYQDTFRALAK